MSDKEAAFVGGVQALGCAGLVAVSSRDLSDPGALRELTELAGELSRKPAPPDVTAQCAIAAAAIIRQAAIALLYFGVSPLPLIATLQSGTECSSLHAVSPEYESDWEGS